MRIGILSDTHDNLTAIDLAGERFKSRRVGMVIHAGDWVAPFAVKRVAAWGIPFAGIFGNNDGDRAMIQKVSGGIVRSPWLMIDVNGWPTAVVHEPDFAAILAGGACRLVIHGHTHQPSVTHHGEALVVNPGECCGWISGHSTVAEIDTATGDALIVTL